VDDRIRQYVERVATQRAPWFKAGIKKIAWCSEIVFEKRLVRQFGRDRCWLVGDAGHQTSPVGVQSMNLGMAEASTLAGPLRRILREKAPFSLLETCEREWQAEWCRLLGVSGGLKAAKSALPWVQERQGRILSCLPASYEDLAPLAGQLGLGF
jgi:2-polyprenyl-6-methoxyphenol hydroxylase-like FAD-dependent oxidoreductase